MFEHKTNALITIKDIAKKANVSTGTVDRVIHNRPGVSSKTRERVLEIISQTDFQVNKIASSLAMNKTIRIAVLIPESKGENSFWKQPREGVDKAVASLRAYKAAINYFFFDQHDVASYKRAVNTMLEFKPEGALIAPVFHKETIAVSKNLDSLNIPYLFININIDGLNNKSFIGQHAFQSGYLSGKLMAMMLVQGGNILIPLFREHVDDHATIDQRISGFKSCFESMGDNHEVLELSIANLRDKASARKLLQDALKEACIAGIFIPSSYAGQFIDLSAKFIQNDVRIIGYDLTKRNIDCLRAGHIDFLISQNAMEQGFNGLIKLFNLLAFNEEIKPVIYSPIKLITKENLEFNETIDV